MSVSTIAEMHSETTAEGQQSKQTPRRREADFGVSRLFWVSSFRLLDDKLPEQLVIEIENLTGCAVWMVRLNEHGRVQESYSGKTATKWDLDDQSLQHIVSDSSQCSTPIVSGERNDLPFSKSAILDRIVNAEAYRGILSFSHKTTTPAGCWSITFAWRADEDEGKTLEVAAWQELNAKSLGSTLELWTQAQQGRKFFLWFDRVGQWRNFSRRSMLLAICSVAFILSIPLPYRPQRKCTLQPSHRRFVASPIEGQLNVIHVRPGQTVAKGDLLASIDDKQLQHSISTANSEFESATKKREIAMAGHASGDLRLATLECQQIEIKLQSLNEQLSKLVIIAPEDGVIVQGDWFGNEGLPVTLGQTLFEIASLEKMKGEVQILAKDLPYIGLGNLAIVRTESTGSKSFSGKISHIEPKSEVIDDQAVYLAEVELDSNDPLFRPGMEAEAVVSAGYKPIGWILFNKPYRWLANQWVW